MKNACNVWPARGRTVFSRFRTTDATTGLILTDSDGMDGIKLPRSGRTIGWELTLTNKPTTSGGTAVNLLYMFNPPVMPAQAIVGMLAAGEGEILAPGSQTVITIPADQERLIACFAGLQNDWTTGAAVTLNLTINELVALEGSAECVQPGQCKL